MNQEVEAIKYQNDGYRTGGGKLKTHLTELSLELSCGGEKLSFHICRVIKQNYIIWLHAAMQEDPIEILMTITARTP